MRSLVLFLVGLAVGALGTLITVNALDRGTSYPHAVMAMMGQQMMGLGRNVKVSRCASTDLTPRLQTLRFVTNDIEPAFADLQSDAQFGRYAADLRAAADAALMTPPANCTAAAAAISRIKKSCDACHREYKN